MDFKLVLPESFIMSFESTKDASLLVSLLINSGRQTFDEVQHDRTSGGDSHAE